MDFIAIDFETANNEQEPCSLSIVEVKNNNIINSYDFKICPSSGFIGKNQEKIHGISYNDVKDAQTFGQLWKEIKHLFVNNNIVAHNMAFDFSILRKATHNDDQLFSNKYFCTKKFAERFLPNLKDKKLRTVCDQLKIELKNHHTSLPDAQACASIMLKFLSLAGDDLPHNYIPKEDYKPNKIYPKMNFDKITTFIVQNSNFVLTGDNLEYPKEKLKEIIEKLGGKVQRDITKTTDYLIIGKESIKIVKDKKSFKSGKILKGEKYKNNGLNIKIKFVKDIDFIQMVKDIEVLDFIQHSIEDTMTYYINQFKIDLRKNETGGDEKSIYIVFDETIYKKKYDYLFLKCKTVRNKSYILIRKGAKSFLDRLKIKSDYIKSDMDFLRIDRNEFINLIKNQEYFREFIYFTLKLACSNYSFGCCSKYIECSNEKRCLHSDKAYAFGCEYKKHLDNNEIFYGKNRNT